jgi:hypothetical protein
VEELAEAYRYPPHLLPDLHGRLAGTVRGLRRCRMVAKITARWLLISSCAACDWLYPRGSLTCCR